MAQAPGCRQVGSEPPPVGNEASNLYLSVSPVGKVVKTSMALQVTTIGLQMPRTWPLFHGSALARVAAALRRPTR